MAIRFKLPQINFKDFKVKKIFKNIDIKAFFTKYLDFKNFNWKNINFKNKDSLPFLIFFGILLILFITSNLTGWPPQIESLDKKILNPGDELVIYGNYFGNKRGDSKVLIADRSPPTDLYQEWSNRKISFIITEDMKSGLVQVKTGFGLSKELIPLLIRKDLPEIAEGPSKPGEPFITKISPEKGTSGNLITISGLNFGQEQSLSNIYFTWLAGEEAKKTSGNIFSTLIPARDYDFDYVHWSDREIKIRIPDGSSSGPLLIRTDKGISSSFYLEIPEPIGKKLYAKKLTYQVSYNIRVENINSEPNNGLYIWVPRILESPEQREVKVQWDAKSEKNPEPQLENYKGIMQYYFEDLKTGDNHHIKVNFIFDRYEVTTKISNIFAITNSYENTSKYLQPFLLPEGRIPSDSSYIKNAAQSVTQNSFNPYTKARELYNYILNTVSYINIKSYNANIIEMLQSGKPSGNSLQYALLFCTLARSINIPARPVSGYLIDSQKNSIEHFWAEFYIENFGWIPLDPVLGDGGKPVNIPSENNNKEYYFGNIDNHHVTFSRGITVINQMDPKGKIMTAMQCPSFQTIYEESIGNLSSYTTTWSGLEDIGVY